MNILLTGASGMVGQAALAACRLDPRIDSVVMIVRRPTGLAGGKVREVVCPDLFDIASVEDQLGRPDACLFCAGVSSVGMVEKEYRHITYDLTLATADVLVRISPAMRFLYVSGSGTDSNEASRQMWKRVKGATENALLKRGFAGVALFRPGYIQPCDGIRSKVGWYNSVYAVLQPFYPLFARIVPQYVTDSETLGRAMLIAIQEGVPSRIYESRDINEIGV